ncbi:MAG: (Fe-S)-binding protein [Fimbriimonadaceae bacterium]|nr:(Fe-S)-binding protein [Fimbriimonadaceae bacterium]
MPKTPTREEFLFFSLPEKLLFYALAIVTFGYIGWTLYGRVRQWQLGRPVDELRPGWKYWLPTRDAASKWLRNIGTCVLAQRKVRSSRPRTGAPMHLLIFYGFLALTLATTLLAIATYSPVNFHGGNYYLWYELIFDTLGLLLAVGLVWAIIRRAKAARDGATAVAETRHEDQRKDQRRYPISHHASDMAVLILLLALTLNGYWLEAARISANPQPWDQWSWVGYAIAQMQGPFSPVQYKAVWWFHIVLVMGFFALIPHLRIRHVLLAIASTAGTPDKPMGQLRTIPMEEVEQTEQIGAKRPRDFSRWHLMSLDACMECGRCTEVCPAWNVGKALNPKQVVQHLRDGLATPEDELAPRVTEEALWQCTTCNACVEACPVNIQHVDMIVDLRRNLVSEGQLSGSAAVMLRQTASTKNAWGTPAREREKWMEGLDIPLCRDGATFEYLFWVGCAGATDANAVRTTKAVAALLKRAGVSFACLGQEEACTGDPARRVGEEFLFQEAAATNQTVFERYGVRKVVTACPHCFNTLQHEYGDFGQRLEVFHHTQLLQSLVRKGDLVAAKPTERTVLHDPCYLGRVNGESDAPRALVEGIVDPEFSRHKTRCCGAGGGRMWMDEANDERPANARADQLLATGAKTVALGCPFCRIMLEPALNAKSGDSVRLLDLAEMLQAANPPETPTR